MYQLHNFYEYKTNKQKKKQTKDYLLDSSDVDLKKQFNKAKSSKPINVFGQEN